MLCLSGCFFTKEDLTEYTKRRLKEEYGEEFEIKTVVDTTETIVYPVNNPDLLFRAWYVVSNGNGANYYVHQSIANQYKELALEKLKDFPFDYCVNTTLNCSSDGLKSFSPSTTIEQFQNEFEGIANLRYRLYFSSDSLVMTDEQIYDLLNKITLLAEPNKRSVSLYFLTSEDLNKVKEKYENFSYPVGTLYSDVLDKYESVWQFKEDGELLKTIDDVNTEMEEIRKNELFG